MCHFGTFHCACRAGTFTEVEVVDWSGDRCPRGRYLEALKMNSRHTDMSILEAVQTFARLAIILSMFEIISKSEHVRKGMFPNDFKTFRTKQVF